MFLSLGIAEALGCAFGAVLIAVSVWLLYLWAIKPERETRRQQTWLAAEEMHRIHRKLRIIHMRQRRIEDARSELSGPVKEQQQTDYARYNKDKRRTEHRLS
jgi:hypothetical protein